MKILAYFLPQFYPTPENNKYWGEGFTDWENVKSSKPLFKGHKQPYLPSKFGMYDLSDIEKINELSEYSIKCGIDGFGYWHYWFGNNLKTLQKVQEFHIRNKKIKQNFFFAWANQDWTKSWVGDDDTIIFKQEYSKKSALDHFKYLKSFIEDDRYIKKDGMPLFQVINPDSEGCVNHIKTLENESKKFFGKGFFWLFPSNKSILGLEHLNFARVGYAPGDITSQDFSFKFKRKVQKFLIKKPIVISNKKYLKLFNSELIKSFKNDIKYYPCIISGWDNTPRYKNNGFLIKGNVEKLLKSQLEILKKNIENSNDYIDIDFVFIKAWNEWAEGNILEPFSYKNRIFNPAKIIKVFKSLNTDLFKN